MYKLRNMYSQVYSLLTHTQSWSAGEHKMPTRDQVTDNMLTSWISLRIAAWKNEEINLWPLLVSTQLPIVRWKNEVTDFMNVPTCLDKKKFKMDKLATSETYCSQHGRITECCKQKWQNIIDILKIILMHFPHSLMMRLNEMLHIDKN